ncbi:helix-turn-helix domain-containing protein [Roseivirga sp. BDSF3-8]|uniref:helix-turn-helix domain-containing protein n=1 Tax=Roseivirga sp. BDSF3-8 TaxID=3241598 RepID=UPI00353244C8
MKDNNTLFIKNMVCPRCIEAVRQTLLNNNIPFTGVELGRVELAEEIDGSTVEELGTDLATQGFELLEENNARLVSRIKSLIVHQIHHSREERTVNFSTLLEEGLHHDYAYMSRLFSSVEGMTIEKFVTRQKIERVKELLCYNEMSLSQIAADMQYSSTSYLSSQFKKETGMTPSDFKKLTRPERKPLDSI